MSNSSRPAPSARESSTSATAWRLALDDGVLAPGLTLRTAGTSRWSPSPRRTPALANAVQANADSVVDLIERAKGPLPHIGLLTVANALHWMDATAVFAAARQLLCPGGGVAVITHGRPL